MSASKTSENEFLAKLRKITEAKLSNPQFGVSMLAKEMGMSRSNLHRKVILIAKITVSQFICHVRLKKAKDILRHTSNTVSEVAYEVGFSNVSYFIKCFHNYYGYSPGQVGDREETQELSNSAKGRKHLRKIYIAAIAVALIGVMLILVFKPLPFQQKKLESSIIMLPMDNWETNDSITINGVLESIRDNLCKISEIDMKPPVSVLRSGNSANSDLEIAQKYKANYLIQPKTWWPPGKENIYLALDLIEVQGNTHVETFSQEINSKNLTSVHLNFIKDITDKLNISISTEEQVKIDKRITWNDTAWRHYFEGIEIINLWYSGQKPDLKKAITSFEKAIKYDIECASAYARLAWIYFTMDYHWNDPYIQNPEILYGEKIYYYAEKAMFYDPQLDLSLNAKALYCLNQGYYELAIDNLEDALKYNSNSYLAIVNLCYLYSYFGENEKFIEFALKSINSNLPNTDSIIGYGKEGLYADLGRKYRSLGFIKESLEYLNKALEINPKYIPAINEKSQVICDLERENNYQESIKVLLDLNKLDSTKGYTFLGLSYYVLRDYQSAYDAFNKMLQFSGKNLEDYVGFPSGRFAVVLSEMGEPENAQIQINNFREFAESSNNTGTKSYRLIAYYSFIGDTAKAMEHLEIMSKYDHFYHRIRLLNDAPIYDNIRELPKFQQTLTTMKARWQEKHDSVRIVFEKKDLL